MRASSLLPLLCVTVLAGTLVSAPVAIGAGPPSTPASHVTVPPLVAEGPITLPNGRVLPVRPSWVQESSVAAEMLTAHANERPDFTPGERPRSIGSDTASLSLAPIADPMVSPLGVASPGSAYGTLAASSLPNGMRKEVLGFLPYWMLSAAELQWMQYQLVTTIAYFGVAARSDGSLATTSGGAPTAGWSGWTSSAMTNVTNAAHSHGVRVVLTITMMAWDGGAGQAALLGNATARGTLVTNIVAAVRDRNADGVNLDFEPVYVAQRDQYTSFVRQLKAGLVAGGVGSYLTVDSTAGAATWSTGYDVAGLTAAGAADAIFVMGYDYSWSGSSRAGGVAPMDSPYILDVNESVDDFLSLTPASKVIWGVPYYGRTWQTTSDALNATTRSGASGASKAYYYTGALNLAATHGRRWDDVGKVPWFAFYDPAKATWVQGYYDDPTSLGHKYNMVNARGLAGTGMWTLLMDRGDNALWNLLAANFVNDTTPPTGGIRVLPIQTDASAAHVEWAATDFGSGVASYTVQVRDRTLASWTTWLTGTTATHGYYVGAPGHGYEFRVSARDFKGNQQPWLPSSPEPGVTVAAGGFGSVATDLLNVRAGAGTGFSSIDQLTRGSLVAVLAGPIDAGGYRWYQVQFDFTEWPSSTYPRLGWVAGSSASGPYLAPSLAPNLTTISPSVTAYSAAPRATSPNGDGVLDGSTARFTLPRAASTVRLDVLSSGGQVVGGLNLGPRAAGVQTAAWDGRLTSGAWATAGSYLLRVTVTDAVGSHPAPASGVDAGLLARWGVSVDLTRPTASSLTPLGSGFAPTITVTATFSEPVTGVAGPSFRLIDSATGASVAGSVTYDPTTRRATYRPSSALGAGRLYRATLLGSIHDAAGNAFSPIAWTFRTAAAGIILYQPARTLTFLSGTHTGYRFDASGRVTTSKTATLTRASGAPTSQRSEAIPAHSGPWFLVVAGIWEGYWVRESPSVYLPGVSAETTFTPARTVSFAAGSYTGYRFDRSGNVTARKAASLARSSGASASKRAIINGRSYLLIVNGIWEGYWIPVSSSTVLS